MICPKCGRDNTNETDACVFCGEKLPTKLQTKFPAKPQTAQMEQPVYTERFSQGNPYITGINPNQQNFHVQNFSQQNFNQQNLNQQHFNQQNFHQPHMGMKTPVFTPQIQKNNGGAQTDHTSEFRKKDIARNKIYAMLPYLMGVVGVVIALLAAKKSKYVQFHVRQALKLTITSVILAILAIPFLALGRIPIAGIMFLLVAALIGIVQAGVWILKLIGFFQVCEGMAKEPAVVRSFQFLK